MASFLYFGDLDNPDVILDSSGIKSCNIITESSLLVNQLAYDQLIVNARNEGEEIPFITADDKYFLDANNDQIYNASFRIDYLSYPYGTPVWIYEDTTLLGKYYIYAVKRTSKYIYEITAVSPIGLMVNMSHNGGLYNGETFEEVLTDIIGESAAGTYNERVIDDDVASTPIYGYLPATNQRNNLHQLLFATGVNCKRDTDGVMYFTFPDSSTAITIADNEVYIGGSISYSDPSTSVEITEHGYSEDSSEEKLFSNIGGEAAVSTLITFSSPHHDLRGDGLTVDEEGANYAVVSGTGELYGQKYTHTTATLTKATGAVNEIDKVTKISDCTLINYLNSESVANRAAMYYANAKTISANILQNGRLAGDVISFKDPFGEITGGFISEMNTNISSVFKASCQIITGYMPSGGGNAYNNVASLTSGGVWHKPDGITKIRIVLIGGGSCGANGSNGANGSFGSGWTVGSTSCSTTYVRGGTGGKGGAGGAGGTAGKIYQLSLTVDSDAADYEATIGTGGTSSASATHSTLTIGDTTYSSENGAVSQLGFTDLINGITYAVKGKDGVAGADGMNGNDTGTTTNSARSSVTDTTTSITYYGGEGCENAYNQTTYEDDNERTRTLKAYAGGAGGGGAAIGGEGTNATAGSIAQISRGFTWIHLAVAGDGADGGYAEAPSIAGCGGNGGNGGGGGGGVGGCMIVGNDQYLTPRVDYSGTLDIIGNPLNGGSGGAASAGADGIVLIYY